MTASGTPSSDEWIEIERERRKAMKYNMAKQRAQRLGALVLPPMPMVTSPPRDESQDGDDE